MSQAEGAVHRKFFDKEMLAVFKELRGAQGGLECLTQSGRRLKR